MFIDIYYIWIEVWYHDVSDSVLVDFAQDHLFERKLHISGVFETVRCIMKIYTGFKCN